MKKTVKTLAKKPDKTLAVFILLYFVGIISGSLAYLVYAGLFGKELYSAYAAYRASDTPFFSILLQSAAVAYVGLLIILLSSNTRFCPAVISFYMALCGAPAGATLSALFGCLGPYGIPAALAFILPQTLCLLLIRLFAAETAVRLADRQKVPPRALIAVITAPIIPVVYDALSISIFLKKL